MKRIFLAAALLIPMTSATAQEWNDPMARFDAKKNKYGAIQLTWVYVDNINQACEKESRHRGLGGIGYSVEACSFWVDNHYTIITKKRPNGHELGHEVRHCFQGNYH